MITIIANIPERTNRYGTFPARTETFTADESGKWTGEGIGPMSEYEVIDVCRKASNWKTIRAKHFPMEGFHS